MHVIDMNMHTVYAILSINLVSVSMSLNYNA